MLGLGLGATTNGSIDQSVRVRTVIAKGAKVKAIATCEDRCMYRCGSADTLKITQEISETDLENQQKQDLEKYDILTPGQPRSGPAQSSVDQVSS